MAQQHRDQQMQALVVYRVGRKGRKGEIRHKKRKHCRIKRKKKKTEARKDCLYPGKTSSYSGNKLQGLLKRISRQEKVQRNILAADLIK